MVKFYHKPEASDLLPDFMQDGEKGSKNKYQKNPDLLSGH